MRTFDESPYENENVLGVCPSTAYREIMGNRDTHYIGFLCPVGEGQANMLIVKSRDNPGAERHMDNERCCPEGSAEQEQTNMFIKEVQKDPEKASQGNDEECRSAYDGSQRHPPHKIPRARQRRTNRYIC
jgi:hypothetical protein